MMMNSTSQLEETAFDLANGKGDNSILLATNGKLELLKGRLLAGTGDCNYQDTNGYSPLMAAASYGQLEVVKFLLEQPNIQVNLQDMEGDTAMHYCTDVECMKVLLAAGGDLSIKNSEDHTALEAMEEQLSEEEVVDLTPKEEENLRKVVEFLHSVQK